MSVNSKDEAINLANEYLIKEGYDQISINTDYNIIVDDMGNEWRVSYIKKDWTNIKRNEKGEIIAYQLGGGELAVFIDKKNNKKIKRIFTK